MSKLFIAKRPRYGMTKVLDEIEVLLREGCHGQFYDAWMRLTPYGKHEFRNELRLIIRRTLLGQKWWSALSKDVITEKGINTKSHVYRYIKTQLFHGDARKMFMMLTDWSGGSK